MLFVSLVCPHFPLIARPEWYDLYPEDKVPLPALYARAERPDHPYVAAIRECQIYDQGLSTRRNVRRAIAAYFGLVSFIDHNVGRLLDGARRRPASPTQPRVIYTSDHGDNLGTRGLWGKSTMYEEAAGVPMILGRTGRAAGRCLPRAGLAGRLLPDHPRLDRASRRSPTTATCPAPRCSTIVRGTAPRRTVLSEYHAAGAATGAFMIRKGRFKFVHYVGMPPQLFDLDADPQEARDLAGEPGYRGLVAECEAALRQVVDPEAADAQARADQAARIAAFGGREAILSRGSFGYSPAPGTQAIFN